MKYFFLIIFTFSTIFAQERVSPPLTWEKLKVVIDERNISNIDQLMEVFPKQFLDSVIMIEKSQSSVKSGVDINNPRLIFTDKDSGFTIAVNTNSDNGNYNVVEVIDPAGEGDMGQPKLIDFSNTKNIIVEDPNAYYQHTPGKKCSSCHGENDRFRYRWSGVYNKWKGTFPDVHASGRGDHFYNPQTGSIYDVYQIKHSMVMDNGVVKKNLGHLSVVELSNNVGSFSELVATKHRERIVSDIVKNDKRGLFEREINFSSVNGNPKNRQELYQVLMQEDNLKLIPKKNRDEYITTLAKNIDHAINSYEKKYLHRYETDAGIRSTMRSLARSELKSIGEYIRLSFMGRKWNIDINDWFWEPGMTFPFEGGGVQYQGTVSNISMFDDIHLSVQQANKLKTKRNPSHILKCVLKRLTGK